MGTGVTTLIWLPEERRLAYSPRRRYVFTICSLSGNGSRTMTLRPSDADQATRTPAGTRPVAATICQIYVCQHRSVDEFCLENSS